MASEHALMAGGGSGGHVFPALAVADELRQRGWQVSWMGRSSGMEKELVEARGLPYHGLPAKAVVGRGPFQKLTALGTLGASSWRARQMIHDLQADVVLGTGGYVSVPGVLGAALNRRPIVLLEPNAEAGSANRWLSRWASSAAVALAGVERQLRCPSRVTGVPVRREFFEARDPRPANGALRLLVLGGSQGARQLNQLVPSALCRLGDGANGLEVVHQVGEELLEEAQIAYRQSELGGLQARVVPFLEDVATEMAAADLVISRAGAVTVAEICASGRAALLVPLALAGGHQVANAQRLETSGGAVVLAPEKADAASLARLLEALFDDRQRLRAMGQNLRGLAWPRAAKSVADLLYTALEAA
ncbi:MAG: undecaprenyldiphospho-muramoylpentapeptide beta-N-acetylglucosaminyltransferase [Bacteroidia bacterium]|nr:undecaprenyldiphospho-muramoylpentapeptide beta-N-acetylglucosaminyltransferase [Bacteroidia bacterium]